MYTIIIVIVALAAALIFLSWLIVRLLRTPRQTQTIADLLKQGKVQAALRGAKMLVLKDPHNGAAHWQLARAYLADNKPELALMELKAVNHIGQFGHELPEVEFRESIAALYERFNQNEEALKEYILLNKIAPRARHFMNAGRLFDTRGRTDVAINYLRKAIEMDARLAEAHHSLGLILYRTKHSMEAKAELDAAVKWNSEDAEAYYYLGKIFKEMSDYTAALLAFEKAARGQEFKLRALVERGGCYMSQGAMDKAIPELERAVKIIKDETLPESLYGRYFLAMCYEKTREIDRAIEQWEQIYTKKPGFRDVAEKLKQYQEYRTDDRMKDYLTCGKEDFVELCKALVQGPMDLSIRNISDIPNGIDIIAVENDSQKWVAAKKMLRLLRFLRVSNNLDEPAVRSLHDQMKKLGINRGGIISSAGFSRAAMEFAENRSVELFTQDRLQELLNKTKMPSSMRPARESRKAAE